MAEHPALFGDGDGPFLRGVVFFHHHGFFRFLYRKANRFPVENVSPWTLLFIQGVISGSDFFRQHQGPCTVSDKGIQVYGAGVADVLGHPFPGIGIEDFDRGPGQRNDLSGFRVLLLEFKPGSKGGVVQNEIIGPAMLGNGYCKIRRKLLPFRTGGLADRIFSVGQVLGLAEAVFICEQDVTLGFLRVFIAACAGQVNLELRSLFRLLDLIGAASLRRLVGMLGDGDGAHDRVLCHSQRDAVVFQGKIPRLRAYGINGFVQQVPLAGGNLPHGIPGAAGIIPGREFPAVCCGIGIQQRAVLIKAVHGSVQSGIPLGCSRGGICFPQLCPEFFQGVVKGCNRGLSRRNRHPLGLRLDILARRLFRYGVGSCREVIGLDGPIRSGGNVLLHAAAGNVEGEAGDFPILRSLDYL